MASKLHTEWIAVKKKLSEATNKELSKKKGRLGPNLDDFDKFSKAFDKESQHSPNSGKASKLIDALKKLRDDISSTATVYEKIVKNDSQAQLAKKKLTEIDKYVKDEFLSRAKLFAAAKGQGL
jgi:hypothetical protein